MTPNHCCVPLKTGVRMVTHLSMVVSLAVGWSSFLLLSISSEVSRSLSTTVLSSRTVSEKSNKEPNLLSNPHTFQSHYLDQANHGQWIIPYEYMLYYKWHQLQQQLNNAGGTRQLGYQQQRQSINENHIIASSNLKNWGLTREVENIHNEFHKIEQPHDMASLDHAENLSVIMDNSYNSLLDPGLQQHEPNGMLTFHTNGKIKRKQKYAKLLLICGLLSLCTVIFQFLTSFLLLCFVDKANNAAAQIWTAVNCSVIFSLATCLVLFLCEGLSIRSYLFDEMLYLGLITLDSLLSTYFLILSICQTVSKSSQDLLALSAIKLRAVDPL